MQKFSIKFFISILFLILSTNVNAKMYKVNDIVENKFFLNKKTQINLPKGKWIFTPISRDDYYGLATKIYTLVRLENNTIVESIEIVEMKTGGIHENIVNQAIYEAMFKNQYDGCYERPEYFVVKVYKKGNTHNCLTVYHQDVKKDFFTPDDPEVANAALKKWVRDNNLQLPGVGLGSFHSYFSRLAGGKWYMMSFGIDPRVLDAPKNNYISEESSEYHKNNILNYPDHLEIMKKWVSISAQRHIEFENLLKIKEKHKLDLTKFSPSTFQSRKNISNEILDQINKLNDLYKSGVLTKDEFEKAKKKILN